MTLGLDQIDDQRSLAATGQLHRDRPDAQQDEKQQDVDGDRQRHARRTASKRRLVIRRAKAIGGQRSSVWWMRREDLVLAGRDVNGK